MAKVEGVEKLFSARPSGCFGKFNQFGISQLGFSLFGDSDVIFPRGEFGSSVLGDSFFGDMILLSGIYQNRTAWDHVPISREKYYIPKNPRSDLQQANREKMAIAVAAWQALSSEEKKVYNQNAVGLHMSGYNLFLSKYLLT